ncbi:MAG: hypothetical protein PHZ26_02285 [Candidatus Gracilibacteria bacterium]|nr:hypothetical protein [Candidatus Gracilibacteria bacterium]MDD2908563.1 hypothetical protein [Candidatus Gracilibacteria bacterium]
MRHINLERADNEIIHGYNISDEDPRDILEYMNEKEEAEGELDFIQKGRNKKINDILTNKNEDGVEEYFLSKSQLLIRSSDMEGTLMYSDMKPGDFCVITKSNKDSELSSTKVVVDMKYYIYKDFSGNIFYIRNPLYGNHNIQINSNLMERFVKLGFNPINKDMFFKGLNKEISILVQQRISPDLDGLELLDISIYKK